MITDAELIMKYQPTLLEMCDKVLKYTCNEMDRGEWLDLNQAALNILGIAGSQYASSNISASTWNPDDPFVVFNDDLSAIYVQIGDLRVYRAVEENLDELVEQFATSSDWASLDAQGVAHSLFEGVVIPFVLPLLAAYDAIKSMEVI